MKLSRMAEEGAPAWSLVVAGHQETGRGRLGRTWTASPGSSLLASSWRGTSAGTYGNASQQQREEFDQLIATLNDIVEKGSEHMRSVANLDQG